MTATKLRNIERRINSPLML